MASPALQMAKGGVLNGNYIIFLYILNMVVGLQETLLFYKVYEIRFKSLPKQEGLTWLKRQV